MRERTILHVDCDAYFLSVERALNPALEGRPAAVCGGGRAVVLTASYEARQAGVRAGMPVSMARRACPQLVCVNGRHEAYSLAGRALFSQVREELGCAVEQASIDEAYVDASALVAAGQNARDIAEQIRQMARERFALPVSVGIGPSLAVAKMATELAKPDGIHEVRDPALFLEHLPVSAVPGIGPALTARLNELDIRTVGQLRQIPHTQLRRRFGARQSAWLEAVAHGTDTATVEGRGKERSIGVERTFARDLGGKDLDEAFDLLLATAIARLRRSGQAARSITIVHRNSAGAQVSASATLEAASADVDELARAARRLHRQLAPGRLRLAGVSFTQLCAWEQAVLAVGEAEDAGLPAVQDARAALADVAYRGMKVCHARFGDGQVLSMDADTVTVSFSAHGARVLDVRSPKLQSGDSHWA